MTRLKVNTITNRNDNGPVLLPHGATIPSGQIVSGQLSVAGIVTATSFVGDGSQISGVVVSTISKSIALNRIFSFNECYRA